MASGLGSIALKGSTYKALVAICNGLEGGSTFEPRVAIPMNHDHEGRVFLEDVVGKGDDHDDGGWRCVER